MSISQLLEYLVQDKKSQDALQGLLVKCDHPLFEVAFALGVNIRVYEGKNYHQIGRFNCTAKVLIIAPGWNGKEKLLEWKLFLVNPSTKFEYNLLQSPVITMFAPCPGLLHELLNTEMIIKDKESFQSVATMPKPKEVEVKQLSSPIPAPIPKAIPRMDIPAPKPVTTVTTTSTTTSTTGVPFVMSTQKTQSTPVVKREFDQEQEDDGLSLKDLRVKETKFSANSSKSVGQKPTLMNSEDFFVENVDWKSW